MWEFIIKHNYQNENIWKSIKILSEAELIIFKILFRYFLLSSNFYINNLKFIKIYIINII